MTIFLISLAVFAIAVAGMAVGALISGRCLRGSCGGLANIRDKDGNSICEACTNPSPECQGEPLIDADER